VIAVCRPVSPRLGDCPSFYRSRREQFTCVPHYFPTCGGMASSAMELTAVLANLAPVGASWYVPCSHRSGFEGGGVAVGRPAAIVGRFEGAVDGGPYVAQWQSWRRLVPARPNSVWMSSQCPAWCGSGGDGRTGLIATGMTDPASLTSRRGPA
jgi:hypothetical protein